MKKYSVARILPAEKYLLAVCLDKLVSAVLQVWIPDLGVNVSPPGL